jgi:hypothetical protein
MSQWFPFVVVICTKVDIYAPVVANATAGELLVNAGWSNMD